MASHSCSVMGGAEAAGSGRADAGSTGGDVGFSMLIGILRESQGILPRGTARSRGKDRDAEKSRLTISLPPGIISATFSDRECSGEMDFFSLKCNPWQQQASSGTRTLWSRNSI